MYLFFLSYLDHTHSWTYSFFRSCPQQPSSVIIAIKIKVDDTCIGQAEIDLDKLIDEYEKGSDPLSILGSILN